jgi:glycosyltransferase involved in cell wall biosynthesis
MKLSVLMPVRNGERFIESSLRSLLRQRETVDLDVVVTDDGSTDGTRDIVGRLIAETGPCLRLLQQDGRGLSSARNSGLKNLLPETELIGFLDADDLSPEGRCAADLRHFSDAPALDLVYSLVAHFDGETPDAVPGPDAKIQRSISMGAPILRRHIAEKTGLFDESFEYGGDTDYLFRVFEQRPNFRFLDTVGVGYRQHSAGMSRVREAERLGYLKAYHKAIKRRQADPALAAMGRVTPAFDLGRTPT